MQFLIFILIACAALLAVPIIVFSVEILAACRRDAGASRVSPDGIDPATVVLIPAHDEEAGLAATIASIRSELWSAARVLVIADNCSDGTARVASREGASVAERFDTSRRGKGFALDFGVDQLRGQAPEVLIIVDADCVIDRGALRMLARQAVATGRPVQALYLMQAPAELGIRGRLAEFAWTVKNHARPLGAHALGVPCQLTGSGMAFPWNIICDARLASGHLVEDMQLGLELAAGGTAPAFLPAAVVRSRFAANSEGASSQRTRWEHGHLQMILSQGPRLLGRALRSGDWSLAGLALDLCVPPLALLALMASAVLVAAVLAVLLADINPAVLWLPASSVLLLTISVLLAWRKFGATLLSAGDLLSIPFYALKKIPLYLRFITSKQAGWVRSRRDSGSPD